MASTKAIFRGRMEALIEEEVATKTDQVAKLDASKLALCNPQSNSQVPLWKRRGSWSSPSALDIHNSATASKETTRIDGESSKNGNIKTIAANVEEILSMKSRVVY